MPEKEKSGFHDKESFDAANFPHDVWKYQTSLFWMNDIPVDESGKFSFKVPVSEISTDFIIQVDALSEGGMKHHETTSFSTKR